MLRILSTRQLHYIYMYCCHHCFHHARCLHPTLSRRYIHKTSLPIAFHHPPHFHPFPPPVTKPSPHPSFLPLHPTLKSPIRYRAFPSLSPQSHYSLLIPLSQAGKVAKASAKAVRSATARSYVTTSKVSPSPPSVVLHVVEV